MATKTKPARQPEPAPEPASPAPKPISLRAYATRRGVSPEAVSKAVETGRLSASVVRVGGAPKIGDPELADREWGARTRPRIDHPAVAAPPPSTAPTPDGAAPEPAGPAAPAAAPDDQREYHTARASREVAAARREAAEAELAELELAEKRGDLVRAKDLEAKWVDAVTSCRTKLLGIPTRARQRDHSLTDAQVALFGTLIHEALEELAG